ncbi:MAG: hypothetical protein AVDCRST_MAG08-1963 [uncultured Acetobacteraceae bacterium]|uniref:Uncharacterized protein n=1 Tax=uncultured Acetobacteraceae bacterium TaxID=169975 RepID=A0A6J4IBS1_9PROT|nr:MAG: hypothetical protein AVDCRST_MAG08-1963 [uncultured Acetobacteraceae bacterium]
MLSFPVPPSRGLLPVSPLLGPGGVNRGADRAQGSVATGRDKGPRN